VLSSYVTDDDGVQSILVQHIHTLGFALEIAEEVKDEAGRVVAFKDKSYLYPSLGELLHKVGYFKQFFRAGVLFFLTFRIRISHDALVRSNDKKRTMVLQTVLVMNFFSSLVPRTRMLTLSCLKRPRRTTRFWATLTRNTNCSRWIHVVNPIELFWSFYLCFHYYLCLSHAPTGMTCVLLHRLAHISE
jgi:hypothetical protein